MTLRDIINNLKASEICKLNVDNKVVGLRVKNFNVDSLQFEYFDFELEVIKDKQIIEFIRGIKNMKSISLRRHNGLLMSEAEIHNNLIIKEFEDTESAEKVLSQIKVIYSYKVENQEYKVVSEGTEDTDEHRVFYTIEIASGKLVDVMCIRNDEFGRSFEYIMDCGDGNMVYDSDQNTYADFEFDEELCMKLASEAYSKDYRG